MPITFCEESWKEKEIISDACIRFQTPTECGVILKCVHYCGPDKITYECKDSYISNTTVSEQAGYAMIHALNEPWDFDWRYCDGLS